MDKIIIDDAPVKAVKTFTRTFEEKLEDAEKMELGIDLAKEIKKRAELIREKKRVMEVFKEDEGAITATISSITIKLNRGTKFEDREVYWRYNNPESGKKSLFFFPSGLHIETLQMSDEEKHNLFINTDTPEPELDVTETEFKTDTERQEENSEEETADFKVIDDEEANED